MPGVMRAALVRRSDTFTANLTALQSRYPDIEEEVGYLEEFLRLDYIFPEIPIDPKSAPNTYATKHDYRHLGARGHSRFLITYHATDRLSAPGAPYRTITMLTIAER